MLFRSSNAKDVKVFAMEGEGGITAGASHETINSAWGLGLGNLIYHLDWNDYGIDNRPFSSILYGGPENWFGGHGWKVSGVEDAISPRWLYRFYLRNLCRRVWFSWNHYSPVNL